MTEAFLRTAELSVSASWLVVAVIAFRFLLKQAPRWMHVVLWGLVALRLVCPVALESELSLVPNDLGAKVVTAPAVTPADPVVSPEQSVPQEIPAEPHELVPGISSGTAVQRPASGTVAPVPEEESLPLETVMAAVWMAGMALMALYAGLSYIGLYRRVQTAIMLRGGIYQSEFVESPFVLGLFRPRVYLPAALDDRDVPHVIAHERSHIARGDHWWKPLGYVLLTIHWFNPLMWAAYILLCRDIELACDEKVVRRLGNYQRADYSQALLNCSVHRKLILACPVAFGEVGVKERVKNVLNYRKPSLWITLLTALAIVVSAVCFATVRPAQAEEPAQDDVIAVQPEAVPAEPNRGSSVTLTTGDGIEYTVSATSVTPVGMRFNVDVDVACTFLIENYYWIERQTETGWEALPAMMEDPCHMVSRFGASGNPIFPDPTDSRPVDWSGIYGVLEPGTYRLCTVVFEGEDPVQVEFTIGDPGDSAAAQALKRYYDALNALLMQDSYHVVYTYSDIEDPAVDVDADVYDYNFIDTYEYMRAGDDYLLQEYTYTTDMLNEGFMIRSGVEYRTENEDHGNLTTPVIGWAISPGSKTDFFTRWVSCWTMSEIASVEIAENSAVLNLKYSGGARSDTVTITYDENGGLASVVRVAEYGAYSTREACTSTYSLTVMDTGADAIAERIGSQDVDFCRDFTWTGTLPEDETAQEREFVNTAPVTLDTVSQVIDRAKAETDVPYTNIMVYYDAEAMVWKVEFWVGYGKDYTESVYLNADGTTIMVTYRGPLDI